MLGFGAEPRDWPRATHARLVDKLCEAGARVIVFDLNFKKPSSPEQDQRLADAIARANNVVLVESLQRQSEPAPSQAANAAGDPNTERIVPPIAPLARAAVALASFPLPAVPERVNQSGTFKFGAAEIPTLQSSRSRSMRCNSTRSGAACWCASIQGWKIVFRSKRTTRWPRETCYG